ncbi:MAG: carbohydrate binding domain-containing protein [Gammaproteobacteria bacterium]
MRTTHRLTSAGLVVLLCLYSASQAHEQAEALTEPGYRPGSSLSTVFVSEVATAEIAVFPTIVRTPHMSRYSIASRQRVVEFLNKNGLGRGTAADIEFDMGTVEARSQYEMFLNTMETIGEQLSEYKRQVDYVMVLEVLFPPARSGTNEVFGIHCFVLAPDGTNAFSFLLNSHHKAFVDASLRTSDMTAKGRERLAIKSTGVALTALKEQIEQASGSVAETMDAAAAKAIAGVLDGFESRLSSGMDINGIPIGFFTFSDGSSEVSISTTGDHPPLPGEAAGNGVLRLDLNVSGWAGFLHNFENEDLTEWSAQDWRGLGEIRFWLYGRNSGTGLFVDILDNRNPGSKTDDAERYVFVFDDDFSGWRLITIPFTRMVRKEIGNGAPLDGLGLSEVHGWAFGTLNTDGQATYYIDDFALASSSSAVPGPGAGAVDYPINELPMYGGREKTASQKQADETYIQTMTRDGRSRGDAANEAAKVAWNVYYVGDKSTAIKRFNQAWLLDPDNPLALWGFAATCMDRGQIEDAVRFYRMALENGPEDPRVQYEYEMATQLLELDRSGERPSLGEAGTSGKDP